MNIHLLKEIANMSRTNTLKSDAVLVDEPREDSSTLILFASIEKRRMKIITGLVIHLQAESGTDEPDAEVQLTIVKSGCLLRRYILTL